MHRTRIVFCRTYAKGIETLWMRAFFIGLFFCAFLFSPAVATWTRCTGPTGGVIHQLLVNPVDSRTLFAASLDGLLQSTDAGSTWSLLRTSVADTGRVSFACLAFSMEGDGHLYAGTLKSGLWKSIDGGQSWNICLEFAGGSRIRCLAVHPNDAQQLLVGSSGRGPFLSADGGTSWKRPNGEWRYEDVSAIIPLPGEGPALLMGVWGKGMYLGDLEMAVWERVGSELPLSHVTILRAAMTGEKVFVGTYGHGLFQGKVEEVHFRPMGNELAGLEVMDLVEDLWSPGTLFLCTDGAGVFHTIDGGQSWTPFNDGLDHRRVYSLAISHEWLYAGTCWGGVYRRPR
jgi:hypothetical protein